MIRAASAVLAVLVLGACSDGGTEPPAATTAEAATSAPSDGRAPAFALPSASGGEFSFPQDVQGAPALLYFSMGPG